jgi:hypothetical protein
MKQMWQLNDAVVFRRLPAGPGKAGDKKRLPAPGDTLSRSLMTSITK